MLRGASLFLLLALVGCGPPPRQVPLICGEPQQHRPQRHKAAPWQCGPTLDFSPVNGYQGEFSPVLHREDAVALLDGRCTGTLVQAAAGPVLLTAGHCHALGDRVVAAFNYEEDADGDPLVTEATVIERADAPDYALLLPDALPAVEPVPLTSRLDERLAIIQHPRGLPKVIAEGWLEGACDDVVYYSQLDTLVGASGAGILTRGGYLLGVHSDGDCDATGLGTNRGWSAARIEAASEYLVPEDVADR